MYYLYPLWLLFSHELSMLIIMWTTTLCRLQQQQQASLVLSTLPWWPPMLLTPATWWVTGLIFHFRLYFEMYFAFHRHCCCFRSVVIVTCIIVSCVCVDDHSSLQYGGVRPSVCCIPSARSARRHFRSPLTSLHCPSSMYHPSNTPLSRDLSFSCQLPPCSHEV